MSSLALRRVAVGVVTAGAVAACSHAPRPQPPAEVAHPRSVAIIPVLRAEELTLDRRSPAYLLGFVAAGIERLDRSHRQDEFQLQHEAERATVARQLTVALADAARQRGFDVVVLDNVTRDPVDPDDFDYPRIASDADVVVHVRLRDIGVFNPMKSTDYEPYVDVHASFVARRSGFEMLDENFYYGVNGSRDDPYSVLSDLRDRWPDASTVMAEHDAVEASWMKGANALAKRIVSKLPSPR